jgi:hypothetical protein
MKSSITGIKTIFGETDKGLSLPKQKYLAHLMSRPQLGSENAEPINRWHRG